MLGYDSKKMTSDLVTLKQLAFVDKLRKDIAEKSKIQRKPKVYLEKTNVSRIETIKAESDHNEDSPSLDNCEDSHLNPDPFILFQSKLPLPGSISTIYSLKNDAKTELLECKKELSFSPSGQDAKFMKLNKKGTIRGRPGKTVYHPRNAQTGKYHCASCSKPFGSSYHVRRHYEAVHLKKRFTKSNVTKSKNVYSKSIGNKKSKISCRIYIEKNVETGLYHCPDCCKRYAESSRLRRHYEAVHLKKKYKCETCNKAVYSDSSSLKRHQQTCLQNIETEKAKTLFGPKLEFVCDICGKGSDTEYKHRKHRREVHENVQRYACDLCDRKFKKTSQLRKHRDVFHLGKRHSCAFCNKTFACEYMNARHEEKCSQNPKIQTEPNISN